MFLTQFVLVSLFLTGCLSQTHPGSCPPVKPGTIGTCDERCSSDADCKSNEKCCSNGCGHACFVAVQPSPCDKVKCPVNYQCQVDPDGLASCVEIVHFGVCPERPRGRCVPCCTDGDCADDQKCCNKCCRKACPGIACKCPYGTIWSFDANGCRVCNCRPDPCVANPCPAGYLCERVELPCIGTNCPRFGRKCVPICKYGLPLPNAYCGRGGKPCPPHYYCEIAPNDAYAYCCPERRCDLKCADNQYCFLKDVVCVKAPCYPIPTCVCSGINCRLFCEYGFQKDANGCEICACNDQPIISPN